MGLEITAMIPGITNHGIMISKFFLGISDEAVLFLWIQDHIFQAFGIWDQKFGDKYRISNGK